VAYLFRLAWLNKTSFISLVRRVRNEVQQSNWVGLGFQVQDIDVNILSACLGVREKRPKRWVCTECIRSGMPDHFVPEESSFLEYCLLHAVAPLQNCPSCRLQIRYGVGTYHACQCGYEWGTAVREKAISETYRFYCQIAGDLPLGIEPTRTDLQRHGMNAISARLHATWGYIWTDQFYYHYSGSSTREAHPPFGYRWQALQEALGIGQFKLNTWVDHIACWHRSVRSSLTKSDLRYQIPWTYLRQLFLSSYVKGCSGPRPHECVLVGQRCKSNKQGIRGDRLPRNAGTFLNPVQQDSWTKAFLITDTRPDPFEDEESESLRELANDEPLLQIALIEMVAVGAIQPLKLTHPTEWCFRKGAVQQMLHRWVRKKNELEDPSLFWSPMSLSTRCKLYGVSDLICGLFISKRMVVIQGADSIWNFKVAVDSTDSSGRDLSMEEMHEAVIPTLSPKARRAATIAFLYLTSSMEDHEMELYCWRKTYTTDPRKSPAPHRWNRGSNCEDPITLVWHRDKLVVTSPLEE
jgi:hypothetical protein